MTTTLVLTPRPFEGLDDVALGDFGVKCWMDTSTRDEHPHLMISPWPTTQAYDVSRVAVYGDQGLTWEMRRVAEKYFADGTPTYFRTLDMSMSNRGMPIYKMDDLLMLDEALRVG